MKKENINCNKTRKIHSKIKCVFVMIGQIGCRRERTFIRLTIFFVHIFATYLYSTNLYLRMILLGQALIAICNIYSCKGLCPRPSCPLALSSLQTCSFSPWTAVDTAASYVYAVATLPLPRQILPSLLALDWASNSHKSDTISFKEFAYQCMLSESGVHFNDMLKDNEVLSQFVLDPTISMVIHI